MGGCGWVWWDVKKYGRMWVGVAGCEKVCVVVKKYGWEWVGVKQFGRVWVGVDRCGRV